MSHDQKHLDDNGMCVCRCTDCRVRVAGDTLRCICRECIEEAK